MLHTLTHYVSTREVNMSQSNETEAVEQRRGVMLYRKNPFLASADVAIKTRRVSNKRGDMMLVSNEGELVTQIAGFWEAEEVDSTRFIKLFINGVKALAELSNAGTKVFELLYCEMQQRPGTDQVYLSFAGLTEAQLAGISRATWKRGMAELIEKRFIAAQARPGWFWVNPDFLWNGDRLAFVKEYRRASSKPAVPPSRDPRTVDFINGKADAEAAHPPAP